jgi:hypothetical protein
MLQKILKGEIGAADGDERQRLIDHHLTGKTGPLACERMVDVLDKISANMPCERSISKRTQRWLVIRGLHLAKHIKSKLPGSHNRPEFQRHRYPGISCKELNAKLNQFQKLLCNNRELKVEQLSPIMFKVSS